MIVYLLRNVNALYINNKNSYMDIYFQNFYLLFQEFDNSFRISLQVFMFVKANTVIRSSYAMYIVPANKNILIIFYSAILRIAPDR